MIPCQKTDCKSPSAPRRRDGPHSLRKVQTAHMLVFTNWRSEPFLGSRPGPIQKLNDRQAVVEFLVGTQGFPRTVHSTGCGAFLTNRLRKAWLFYSLSNPLTGSSSRVHRNKKTPLGVSLFLVGTQGSPSHYSKSAGNLAFLYYPKSSCP